MEKAALAQQVDPVDLESTVRTCARFRSGGRVLSTAHAVEELRIRTGDFLNTDRTLADLISATALAQGCAVVLDEEAGPGSAVA
jgi:hypothetical protein